jgi:hypothetical protein
MSIVQDPLDKIVTFLFKQRKEARTFTTGIPMGGCN